GGHLVSDVAVSSAGLGFVECLIACRQQALWREFGTGLEYHAATTDCQIARRRIFVGDGEIGYGFAEAGKQCCGIADAGKYKGELFTAIAGNEVRASCNCMQ